MLKLVTIRHFSGEKVIKNSKAFSGKSPDCFILMSFYDVYCHLTKHINKLPVLHYRPFWTFVGQTEHKLWTLDFLFSNKSSNKIVKKIRYTVHQLDHTFMIPK